MQPCGKETASLDSFGQLYIIANETNNQSTIWLLKYDNTGQQLWSTPFSFSPNITCRATALAVDDDGSVYVIGSKSLDILTLKFDNLGNPIWFKIYYYGTSNNDDKPIDVRVDKNGNVFVAGLVTDTDWHDNFATIKYDTQGTLQWVIVEYLGYYSNTGDLEIDDYGDVYVAMSNHDFITCKYSNNGSLLWREQYSNSAWGWIDDVPVALAYDGKDNIYVTGTSSQPGFWSPTASLITTLKYDRVTNVIENEFQLLPKNFTLSQNYPNPFNPSTRIKYQVASISYVSLVVYDILGNEIETLVNEEKPAGTFELTWYAEGLPSGVYFYQLKAGDYINTKKMILLK
jgi:hypothetical protein